MKNVVKSLFGIVLTFIGLVNVNAWTMGDDEMYGRYTGSNITVKGASEQQLAFSYYTVYDNNSKSYSAYCLDSTKTALSKGSTFSSVTKINGSKDPLYKGLTSIAYSSNSNTESGRVSTLIALRTFKMASGAGSTELTLNISSDYQLNYNYIMYNTAMRWLAENAELADAAFGYKCASKKNKNDRAECYFENAGLKGAVSINKKMAYASGEILNDDNSEVAAAKAMFKNALSVASNGSSSVSNAELKYHSTTKEDSNNVFVQYDYYKLELKNGESIKNITLDSKNNDIQIVSYKVNDGKEIVISNLNSLNFKGNQTITFKIKGTVKPNTGYKCEPLNYTIKYDFESENGVIDVYLLSNGSKNQSFVAFDGGLNKTITKDLKMDFCGNNACAYYDPEDFEQMTEEEFEDYTEDCCTDLDNYCEDKDNKNRDYYCDLYSEYCGACDTEIVIPEVCTYIDGEDGEAIAEDMTGYVKSAVDDDGKSNIKACLLMRKKDEAGNSYKAMENSYCKVYCKEDYSFNLPTAVSINSGTYFQLDATVTGTKTCYTSEIDTAKFTSDISSLSTNSQAYKEKVAEYNACINMEVDYDCFDPEIEYEYEEIYNDQLGSNDKFVQSGSLVETNKNTTYCNSDINDDYGCKDSSTKVASNITGVAFTTKYVKSTVTKTGVYTTPSVFYTQHPSGTITTDKNAENATLINGLPVSVNTEKGRHKFTLNITNLGEYYGKSSCENGRIVGGENSILDKQVKNGLKTTSEYMCYYDVNCPECEFDCEGPLCDLDFCDGDECTATCLGNGCAYDTGAGLSYAYRTITLGSLNPNGRNLGYNWNPTNSVKAKETIDEIETTGETAYEDAEYSFTLTPALISEIKEYNRTKLNDGGYADQSLTCKADKFGNENVNCESDFITKLVKGDIGTRNNKVVVPNATDKFTSWLESDYCNGTCTITKGSGIGPSWK